MGFFKYLICTRIHYFDENDSSKGAFVNSMGQFYLRIDRAMQIAFGPLAINHYGDKLGLKKGLGKQVTHK